MTETCIMHQINCDRSFLPEWYPLLFHQIESLLATEASFPTSPWLPLPTQCKLDLLTVSQKQKWFKYSTRQLLKRIKNSCQGISNTSKYFSKILVLKCWLNVLARILLKLSCFTDFEGHQTLLIDVRYKMTSSNFNKKFF